MRTNLKTVGFLLTWLFAASVALAQTNDSIVSWEADVAGLSMVAADAVPSGGGTFWVVSSNNLVGAPFPCAPSGIESDPTYLLPNGSFLVDGTAGGNGVSGPQMVKQMNAVSNLIVQAQTQATAMNSRAMGIRSKDLSGPPSPGGGGGSGTNDYPPSVTYTPPDYGTNLWIAQWGIVSNSLTGIASNTIADVVYAIQTNSDLSTTNWGYNGQVVQGSDTTNWTAFILPPVNLTNNLFFRLQSEQSSDGSGLPDWWEAQYGLSGVDPNAQDSAGDGYTIYQKYTMGLNPNTFYTPAAPQGVTVSYNTVTGTVTISWLPSPGPVTGYTVTDSSGHSFNVSTASFTESIPYAPNYAYYTEGDPTMSESFQVQADYAGGNSASSSRLPLQPSTVWGSLIPAPNGGNFLVVGNIPSAAAKVRVLIFYTGYYIADNNLYPFSVTTNVDIPVNEITNGFYPAPSSWLNLAIMPSYPFYGEYFFYLQSVDANGNVSGGNYFIDNWGPDNFYDGRVQLKQNLIFQFRVADINSQFGFISFTNYPYYHTGVARAVNPFGYAYSSFYDVNNYNGIYGTGNDVFNGVQGSAPDVQSLNIYRPFEDNELYRNFVFTPSDVDANGNLTTGVLLDASLDDGTSLDLQLLPAYMPTTNTIGSALLDTTTAQYLCTYSAGSPGDGHDGGDGNEGLSYDDSLNLIFSNNVVNYWGLPFVSAKVYYENAYGNDYSTKNTVLNAGETLDSVGPIAIYMNTAQPQFQTVEYDFWNEGFYGDGSGSGPNGFYWNVGVTNLPGNSGFSTTNAGYPIMVGVGQSVGIAAFAKLSLQNGYSGVYGYLQQYLDKAYALDDNGTVTASTTGVVSPYGNYFATQAGAAAVVTMPDPDTGARGTDIVYAVSLNVDANHDGTMDLSWNGTDGTSQNSPFIFWINNWSTQPDTSPRGGLDKDFPVPPSPPNCLGGQITCARDLENFARLWICGVPVLTNNYRVTLSWANVSNGAPGINLYNSVETNGGTGYLTDTNIAFDQCLATAHGSSPYAVYFDGPRIAIATNISPSASFTFPNGYFTNSGNKYLLFEGSGIGSGQLVLTILDNNSNTLVQTGVWLDLHDLKDFYERTEITNIISGATTNWHGVIATEEYPSVSTGNDTNLIVFIHGFNTENWKWLDSSDTTFKRLYWAGYQGKLATVKWPCLSGDALLFDASERAAYKASSGLTTYLSQLRTRFPNYRLNLLVHSQGNAFASEAIKNGAPFDTYILTQGAVAASAYDINTPTATSLLNAEIGHPTPDWQPMGYHGAYTNLTGRIINFYNAEDFVLETGTTLGLPTSWKSSQALKPDDDYGSDGINVWEDVMGAPNMPITDPDVSRAFVARSRTSAIGAQGLGSGEANQGIMTSTIDLNAQFGFGRTQPEHSAEWTWPIQACRPYYLQVINTIKP